MTPELAGADDPEVEQAASPTIEAARIIAVAIRPDGLRAPGFRVL
jgi:hypothetical protein